MVCHDSRMLPINTDERSADGGRRNASHAADHEQCETGKSSTRVVYAADQDPSTARPHHRRLMTERAAPAQTEPGARCG